MLKKDVPWKFFCVCVCVWEGGMEFVVLGKNVFRLFDLKLWQAMKNFAWGDRWMLLLQNAYS